MSEIKLNIVDSERTISGTIHGSVGDAAVASLSAEPETVAELEAAMARFMKFPEDTSPFATFRVFSNEAVRVCDCSADILSPALLRSMVDTEPWDAGVVVIDLAARIVASESSFSQPGARGEVSYHDEVEAMDLRVPYGVPEDWLFVYTLAEYKSYCLERRLKRAAEVPLDARPVLYGPRLTEFIVRQCLEACRRIQVPDSDAARPIQTPTHVPESQLSSLDAGEALEASEKEISAIHARWLMTPQAELRGQTPRDVLLARLSFIDYDLQTRELQWSLLGEGPPCLSRDSHAYRFAGIGTQEWVVYYDLVRHLLRDCWNALASESPSSTDMSSLIKKQISRLEKIKTDWFEQPQPDYEGRIPALITENERKRLPQALSRSEMIVDDNCPICQMMSEEMSMGMGPGFWHLDGAHMDDDFTFSAYPTRAEWEAERARMEEFNEQFNREWERTHAEITGDAIDRC